MKPFSSGFVRWTKFNFVGLLGIGVQLATLALVKSVFELGDFLATALAVEAAVLHNFAWHEAFTWADRRSNRPLARLIKFNLTTGAFSLVGNTGLTRLLTGRGLPILLADGIAVALCSTVNFFLNDQLVFEPTGAE
jgi:putative flippase GtrA